MNKRPILPQLVTAIFATFTMFTSVQADSLIFNTSDSPFVLGQDNQGWWNSVTGHTQNGNYIVGAQSQASIFRNFFTFDLSSLTIPAAAATLEIQRYGANSFDMTETLGLFDVSTSAGTLNALGPANAAIFNDLGTGTSYGAFDVSTAGNPADILSFPLNSAAVADINAAAGGFFSIGGSLTSLNAIFAGDETLFGGSGSSGVQRLVVEAVPEPATWLLLGTGIGGLWWRRRKTKAPHEA